MEDFFKTHFFPFDECDINRVRSVVVVKNFPAADKVLVRSVQNGFRPLLFQSAICFQQFFKGIGKGDFLENFPEQVAGENLSDFQRIL